MGILRYIINLMALTQEEIEKCKEAFNAFDKDNTGMIKQFELKIILDAMGQKTSDQELFRIIHEIDNDGTGIEFGDFLKIIENQKKKGDEEEDDGDTLDAFVALGGNPDRSGCVDASMLIRIIKEEFQMTIDIEKLIKEIDTDG